MREIKFRAWNKKYLTLIYSDKVYDAKNRTQNNNLQSFFEDINSYGIEMEINQFTGLKDKTGKEIYEGDILEEEYTIDVGMEYPSIKKVKQKILIDSLETAFEESKRFCGQPYYSTVQKWQKTVKIIGNKYKNPELIPNE